jgi:hypothetical protein
MSRRGRSTLDFCVACGSGGIPSLRLASTKITKHVHHGGPEDTGDSRCDRGARADRADSTRRREAAMRGRADQTTNQSDIHLARRLIRSTSHPGRLRRPAASNPPSASSVPPRWRFHARVRPPRVEADAFQSSYRRVLHGNRNGLAAEVFDPCLRSPAAREFRTSIRAR